MQLRPDSFNAAYNKARLEFRVAQDCAPPSPASSGSGNTSGSGSGSGSRRGALESALQSHLACLALEGDNLDAVLSVLLPRDCKTDDGRLTKALSNTAQVYASLAETILDDDGDGERELAVALLGKAVDLFGDCLGRQQATLASYAAAAAAPHDQMMDTGDGGGDGDGGEITMADASEDREEYAVVQEPVTPAAVLDTLQEMLRAMTTLLPVHPAPQPLMAAAETLLRDTLPPLVRQTDGCQAECAIVAALARCAIAEARFRSDAKADGGADGDAGAWEAAIAAAFGSAGAWPDAALDADALAAKSDAHVALAQAVPAQAWKHYGLAAQALAAASRLQPARAGLYLARGDTDLLRSRVADCEAANVRALLRKNAGVFYRGAAKLAQTARARREGLVKEAALQAELGPGGDGAGGDGGGGGAALRGLLLEDPEARQTLREAVAEGLFDPRVLSL